jgi:hypothetical protein
MRASALFSVILLGAGVAAAQPKQETEVGRVSLDDDSSNAAKAKDAPRTPSQWLELADATPAKHGTEFVVVGVEHGAFSRLRIDAAKGSTLVRRVRVRFSDGSEKVVRVDASVSTKGRKFREIDLGTTKPIEQIVVITDRQSNGEYALYGSSGTVPGGVVSSR